MIPPPKYEKKSVAYIDKTEIMSSHLVDIPDIRQKVCKFYRINPLLIRSIPNKTEDMIIIPDAIPSFSGNHFTTV